MKTPDPILEQVKAELKSLIERANELELGKHKCKLHNYEHYYVRHVCGHEYCAHTWQTCPRCYGSHPENQTN